MNNVDYIGEFTCGIINWNRLCFLKKNLLCFDSLATQTRIVDYVSCCWAAQRFTDNSRKSFQVTFFSPLLC